MSRMQNAYQRNSEISIFYKNVVFFIWVGVFLMESQILKISIIFKIYFIFFLIFFFTNDSLTLLYIRLIKKIYR